MPLSGKKFCPFAVQRPVGGLRLRRFSPFGLAIHQTGRTIVERAVQRGMEPIEAAAKYYQSGYHSHYLIGWDGTIHQFFADTIPGAHIGVSAAERELVLKGAWELNFEGTAALRLWRERWPGYKSPQHLFPTKSPNQAYIGVELLPSRQGETWFTDDQLQAVIDLAKNRAEAHGWPLGWEETPRLVGHEDVDPYGRWQPSGGWDPGALREKPRFDWAAIRAGLAEIPDIPGR